MGVLANRVEVRVRFQVDRILVPPINGLGKERQRSHGVVCTRRPLVSGELLGRLPRTDGSNTKRVTARGVAEVTGIPRGQRAKFLRRLSSLEVLAAVGEHRGADQQETKGLLRRLGQGKR